MILLILVTALFLRLILVNQGGNVWQSQRLTLKLNDLIKGRVENLVLFAIALCLFAWMVQTVFSQSLLLLLASLLYLYLFYTGHQEIKLQQSESYRHRILSLLNQGSLEGEIDDKNQPIEQLESQVRSLFISQYFIFTLVLTFLFLLLGWYGLVLFLCLYKVALHQPPGWFTKLKLLIEIPVGLFGCMSVALAGKMDAVIGEVAQWQMASFINGLQMFELALITGSNETLEQETFIDQLNAYQAVCNRATYVWVFVVALISIT
ncbi:hypothetical protein A9Q77_01115 [Marinomonas sp. 42_23_T18]|nr:hypothetical protein A9Q77_01115 [Marinomonas sp. 42_23_T18]